MKNKGKKIILIIDNDENVLTAAKRVLQRTQGYDLKCTGVGTLKEAREALLDKETVYDLILLDLMLPDGSGIEIIPEIHALSDAPIIILSAKTIPLEIIKGIERSGDNYIAKPYEPETLTELTITMLGSEKKRAKTTAVPSITITRGKLILDLIEKRVYINGIDAGLEKLDFSLLSLLVREEGKAISAEKIYEYVWRSEEAFNNRLVQEKIAALSVMLENEDCGYAIKRVTGDGYCFYKVSVV